MKIYGGAKDIYWIFIESVVEEREGSPFSVSIKFITKIIYVFQTYCIIAKVYNCTYNGSYGYHANFLENAKIVNAEMKKITVVKIRFRERRRTCFRETLSQEFLI
jgi:hypothetical protein